MPDQAAFQTRTDWRWKLAVQVLERNVANLDYVSRELDAVSAQILRFKYDYDRGLGFRHPAFNAATEVYFSQPDMRMGIEGSLLCGQADDAIAQIMGVPADVIQAYHDLFFDVRGRLESDGWISAVVFGGFAHSSGSSADRRDLALRVAWVGGWDVFYCMLRKGFTSEEERVLNDLVIMSVASRRSTEMVFSAGNYPGSMEYIRTYLDLSRKDSDAKGGGTDDEAKQAGRLILEQFAKRVLNDGSRSGGLVADVSDERNVTLPAREKRASEYSEVATP